YIPFITEEIWQKLGAQNQVDLLHNSPLLISAHWPQANPRSQNTKLESQVQIWQEIIQQIRNLKNELDLLAKTPLSCQLVIADGELADFFAASTALTQHLTPLKTLTISSTPPQSGSSQTIEFAHREIQASLQFKIDFDPKTRLQSIKQEIAEIQALLEKTARLLADPNFSTKAPQAVINKETQKQKDLQIKKSILEKQISYYEKITL
ncbi:MAG TPA: hypothetical protein ENN77_01655, partial [Candidatus Wirthbacteria bacterium]|nr:hypothetical protein [Candidatus Wirthbacteria bacterium]